MHLTPEIASTLSYAPMIAESPVNIECQVTEIKELGSHHMFLAKVTAVHADEAYLNEKNRFELNKTGLIAYSMENICRLENSLVHLDTASERRVRALPAHPKRKRLSVKKRKEEAESKKMICFE